MRLLSEQSEARATNVLSQLDLSNLPQRVQEAVADRQVGRERGVTLPYEDEPQSGKGVS